MVPAGNKTKRLSSVNRNIKHFIIIIIIIMEIFGNQKNPALAFSNPKQLFKTKYDFFYKPNINSFFCLFLVLVKYHFQIK